MITVKNLTKKFGGQTILKDINVTIEDGNVISIIGPSGCGKSTFLRCLNLLEKPTSGQIFLDGQEITAKGISETEVHKKIGMVFQSFNLFGHMNVLENVMFGPVEILKKDRKEVLPKALKLLSLVGLADRALHYPGELSGGQKQRVAIARTLAMEPEIILFDEPTSALDPTLVHEVETVIKNLAASGYTMLIVTHEMRFAREISNRVFFMCDQGICEDGTPEQIFEHPRKEKTRRYVYHLRTLNEEVLSQNVDFIGINGRIVTFGHNNLMPARMIHNAEVIFEELCIQNILPALKDSVRMEFTLEFSEDSGNAAIYIRYDGDYEIDIEQEGYSFSLIRNAGENLALLPAIDTGFSKNYRISVKG